MKKHTYFTLLIITILFTSCANNVPPVPSLPALPPIEDDAYIYDWPNIISRQNDNFTAESFSFDLPIDKDTIKKITLDVKTESGEIAISLKDAVGNKLFDQSHIATSSTHIDIAVSGIYIMEITANSHTGNFTITPVE